MTNIKKVQLPTLIKKDDRTLTYIELKKPDTGNLRGLSLFDVCEMRFDAAMILIPRISILNERDMLNMPIENFAPLMTTVAGFFVNPEQ